MNHIDKFHYKLMAEITASDGQIIAEPIMDLASSQNKAKK